MNTRIGFDLYEYARVVLICMNTRIGVDLYEYARVVHAVQILLALRTYST
jgi:hypothetical protein